MSKKRSIQGKNNHGSIARHPCRSYLKGTCRRTLCDYWRSPEGQCTEQKRAAKPGKSVCSRIIRLMNNKTKSQRKAVKKKKRKRRQECSGCCESCTTIEKALGSIQKERFTQSTLRQASILEKKGPSLGKIQSQTSSSAKSQRHEI